LASVPVNRCALKGSLLEKIIEIGIALEIDIGCSINLFDPDPDSDFDIEENSQ
jgi:hypothetical protein